MSSEYIFVVSGYAAGSRIAVDDDLLIGRAAENAGRLGGDPELSRRHARITWDSGRLVIEDLGSSNGTFVNDARLDGPHSLQAGDVVKVGHSTLEVRSGAPDEWTTQGGSQQVVPTPPQADEPSAPLRPPVEQAGSPSAIRGTLPPTVGPPPPAEVLHAKRRIPVPPGGLKIGRMSENDVVLETDLASRHHARIVPSEGRYFLADLGTMNGTYMNGERLRGESRWLNPGDRVTIGGESLRFLTGPQTQLGAVQAPVSRVQNVQLAGERLSLGRDPRNDVVLDDPNVSRFHAEVVSTPAGFELNDLQSRNGTLVNGQPSERTILDTGSEIAIGPFRLLFDGTSFLQRDDRGALRLDSEELMMAVKGKTILNRCSLSILPGEFIAIIGESGAGKTTLMRALAGVTNPTHGVVAVNGEPVTARLTDIGYVPQDEIVHGHLTVVEALRYCARLRLPRDSSKDDIEGAVRRVVEEVSLQEHAETRIGSLSGGQRKRAGVASELLTRPSLLFLDEPTTGLDPGLETRMMELFRELAEENARSVTMVTHATKNLGLTDKICVMGRGGELTYFGPPAQACDFFEATTYDGIYSALDRRPATEWRREFEDRWPPPVQPDGGPPAEAPSRRRSPSRRRTGAQASVLAQRYLKLMVRDRRNLLILLGQVPLIALFVALLFKSNVLAGPGDGRPSDATQLLFLLVTTCIWFGAIDGSREIIKEKVLVGREAAVGVRPTAYLFSKGIVLAALSAVQVGLLLLIVLALRPLGEPLGPHLALLGLLILTTFVAVGLGLLVSAAVNTEDQATSFIPLVLIPQLLFAGAIVTVKDMSGPILGLSNLVFARWSFAATGDATHMNARIKGDPEFLRLDRYGSDFFDLGPAVGPAILAGFMVVFFVAVLLMLRRTRQ
jgi:ABC-type multidrug transport system ATPase subunit/pSer/pThr/pTyr-binding forkhead associated (FHA) protein/ABC-type multidrug transport system permease subunit